MIIKGGRQMRANYDVSAARTYQTKRRNARLLQIGVFSCAILSLILVMPVSLLIINKGQYEVGEWGVQWLPVGNPWAGGINVTDEGVGTGSGVIISSTTHIFIPPGLSHIQARQWGRLKWWRV